MLYIQYNAQNMENIKNAQSCRDAHTPQLLGMFSCRLTGGHDKSVKKVLHVRGFENTQLENLEQQITTNFAND